MSEARGRPFQMGNTLGRGRPKGSRNKTKEPEDILLHQYRDPLMRKAIALALQGNSSAMRLCMERLSPARRDEYIRIDMPRIRSAQDVDKAADKVTQAVRRGNVTPFAGGKMMNLLETRSRLIERGNFESRLEKLEELAGTDEASSPADLNEKTHAERGSASKKDKLRETEAA